MMHTSHPTPAPYRSFEEALADIWRDVLALESVGLDDDFFALAGDSLSAMRIASRVYDTFDVEVAVRTILDNPTIRTLAGAVAASQVAAGTRAELT